MKYFIVALINSISGFITNLIDSMFICVTKFRSYLFGTITYYVIGDSHSYYTFRRTISFVPIYLGSVTAYGLSRDNSRGKSFERVSAFLGKVRNKNSVILLSFGEIDARIHIFAQHSIRKDKNSFEQIIDETISAYDRLLAYMKSQNINFYVLGIPPAAYQGNRYSVRYYGSPTVRSTISNIFNNKLQKFCIDNNYKFINTYQTGADEFGMISPHFSTDGVHFNRNIQTTIVEQLLR